MPNDKKPKAPLPATIVAALPSSAKFAKALDALYKALAAKIAPELVAAREDSAEQLARAFVAFHRLNDKLDAITKAFEAQFAQLKGEVIPSAFEARGLPNVTLSEGFRVGVAHNFRASIKEGQRDRAFQWLRENKLGDLITTTVNASTLSAAMKHRVEEDNLDAPDELFTVTVMLNTSVTTTKTK